MKTIVTTLCTFIFIYGIAQTSMTPEKWQEDLSFLSETVHKDYPFLFKKTTVKAFDQAVEELHRSIPGMEDHEVVVGLGRIISLFQYGHTSISYGHEQFAFNHLPFNLYQFSDGIYVQGTHRDYRQALGARVLTVAGMPVQEALEAIRPAVNDENDQYFKAHGINYLRMPQVLHAQGVTKELSTTISLGLEKDGETFELAFTSLPEGERPPISYGFIQQQGEWLDARNQSTTPHYLKQLDKHYYYEYLPESSTVYVRYSQVLPDATEDIPTFFGRVFDFVENNAVEKLVLDVRLNGGGNNYNNQPLLREIIQAEKIDQVGKFFVILGRRTYSACQNLASELDTYTNAIFVGEPTAENINFYGDNNRIALPNSGIPVYLSFAWWQDKPVWENGPWQAPHIAVDMSFDEYRTNKDPILETALQFDGSDFVLDPMQYMTQLYQAGEGEKLMSETRKMIADSRYQFYDFEGELNSAGYRMLAQGDPELAVAIFQFVTQLFPDSANAWDSLAEGYWKVGQTDKAIEFYTKALSMDPEGEVGRNAREKLAEINN